MKEYLVITIANSSNKRVSNTQSTSNAASFHPGTKQVSKSSVDETGKSAAVRCYNVAEHIQNHVESELSTQRTIQKMIN